MLSETDIGHYPAELVTSFLTCCIDDDRGFGTFIPVLLTDLYSDLTIARYKSICE